MSRFVAACRTKGPFAFFLLHEIGQHGCMRNTFTPNSPPMAQPSHLSNTGLKPALEFLRLRKPSRTTAPGAVVSVEGGEAFADKSVIIV